MKWIIATATALVTFSSAAAAPLSRGDQMKACAAQWKSEGHHGQGMRYQQFIRVCLKKMAAHV